MSIDPTKISVESTISPRSRNVLDHHENSGKNFGNILDGTVNSLNDIEISQKQSIAQIKLAQLHLLQGLFSVGDESDSNDVFSGFFPSAGLDQLNLQTSQIIDKYHAAQQVSLLKPVPEKTDPIGLMIDQVAKKMCLAPELIHSVVATESAYDSTAVSCAGAQGLMQLMPETAQELGVEDSFDPLQNLLGGSKYLKQLLDKYDGDLDHALAAYNWGQGNVDRHGLEKMPEETRNYLAKIKSRLGIQAT